MNGCVCDRTKINIFFLENFHLCNPSSSHTRPHRNKTPITENSHQRDEKKKNIVRDEKRNKTNTFCLSNRFSLMYDDDIVYPPDKTYISIHIY